MFGARVILGLTYSYVTRLILAIGWNLLRLEPESYPWPMCGLATYSQHSGGVPEQVSQEEQMRLVWPFMSWPLKFHSINSAVIGPPRFKGRNKISTPLWEECQRHIERKNMRWEPWLQPPCKIQSAYAWQTLSHYDLKTTPYISQSWSLLRRFVVFVGLLTVPAWAISGTYICHLTSYGWGSFFLLKYF